MQAPRSTSTGPLPSKRLIVCCDGTWLDADTGQKKGQLPPPSNVTRIGRAIKSESFDKIPQIVFYQSGVGSMGNVIDKVLGGALATGLSENIRGAYNFIANNYFFGDEIYLVGFSRGAFTARSIAGLIGCMGLLTKDGLPFLAEVFEDFEHRETPNYRSAYPNIPFPDKPSASDHLYQIELQRRRLSRLNIPIKAVAVWETVGSLGVPRVAWLERLGLQRKSVKEYSFFDTALNNCIENAFHALALDEHRASFSPTIWEKPRGNRTNLRQVWFPGVHSNVGGGYDDQELANITLAWMISQLEPFIEFDPDYIQEQYKANRQYYLNSNQKVRTWSFGELYSSFLGIYVIGGSTTRTPGNYHKIDPTTGRPTSKPLRNTNEYVHASVRARIRLDGPGTEDKGVYEGKALDDYKLKTNDNDIAIWESRSRRQNGQRKILPESPLWQTERRLLKTSPKVYDYVLEEQPSRPKR